MVLGTHYPFTEFVHVAYTFMSWRRETANQIMLLYCQFVFILWAVGLFSFLGASPTVYFLLESENTVTNCKIPFAGLFADICKNIFELMYTHEEYFKGVGPADDSQQEQHK